MNESDKVKAIQVTYKDFNDWDKLFNDNYGPMKSGSISNYHVFTYESKSPAIIKYQIVHYSETLTQSLIKGKNKTLSDEQNIRRVQKIKDSELVPLKKIGLRPIKQVEMWSKWGPLIGIKEERDALCPKPSDEVIAKVKGDKADKAAGKKSSATTITEDSSSTAAVTTVYVPPTKAISKWTKKENKAWLASRGLLTTGNAPELKDRVKEHKDPIVVVEVAATSEALVPVVHDVAMVAFVDDSITVTGLTSMATAPTAPVLFQSVYGIPEPSKEDTMMDKEYNV